MEFVQRKHGIERERVKVKFKYNDKQGEIYLLDKKAFIIKDLNNKEMFKVNMNENGSLNNLTKSSNEEFEEELKKFKDSEVYLKEKTFDSLKEIIGENIEILVG